MGNRFVLVFFREEICTADKADENGDESISSREGHVVSRVPHFVDRLNKNRNEGQNKQIQIHVLNLPIIRLTIITAAINAVP